MNARRCKVCGDEVCYVHCVYCGTDCDLPEPDHAENCPASTGVYPVRERDIMCPGCGKTEQGMLCSECDEPFAVGDHYTHRELDPINGTPCYEPICLGCAATELASA